MAGLDIGRKEYSIKDQVELVEQARLNAQIERDFLKGAYMKAVFNNQSAFKEEDGVIAELLVVLKKTKQLSLQRDSLKAEISYRIKMEAQTPTTKTTESSECQTEDEVVKQEELCADESNDQDIKSEEVEKENSSLLLQYCKKPKYVTAIAAGAACAFGLGYGVYKYIL